MTQRMGKAVTAGVCAVVLLGAAAAGGAGQPVGRGLSIKDLKRVEQVRGDAGGLSTSLARGPATLEVPNDFNGVYQIPEDAETPYAGWYARVSGATIAVFPRGEYKAGMATLPANTKFFLGTIPLGDRPKENERASDRVGPVNDRVDARAGLRVGDKVEKDGARPLAPDAPLPVTVDTAKDLDGVREAMGKLCADPVYRANRLRELMERVASTAK